MSNVSLSPWVVVNPQILSGAPCFRGTRVPVGVLFENLADGLSIDDIVSSYPSLDKGDLAAVLVALSTQLGPRQ